MLVSSATDSGLFPVVFNLATRASISTNATCGDRGAEPYCRLVEHVKQQYGDQNALQCGVCVRGDHPIQNAIDGTTSWWQSPSIAQGFGFHYVTVTLDLTQVRSTE
jgi:laminin alpha 1/2